MTDQANTSLRHDIWKAIVGTIVIMSIIIGAYFTYSSWLTNYKIATQAFEAFASQQSLLIEKRLADVKQESISLSHNQLIYDSMNRAESHPDQPYSLYVQLDDIKKLRQWYSLAVSNRLVEDVSLYFLKSTSYTVDDSPFKNIEDIKLENAIDDLSVSPALSRYYYQDELLLCYKAVTDPEDVFRTVGILEVIVNIHELGAWPDAIPAFNNADMNLSFENQVLSQHTIGEKPVPGQRGYISQSQQVANGWVLNLNAHMINKPFDYLVMVGGFTLALAVAILFAILFSYRISNRFYLKISNLAQDISRSSLASDRYLKSQSYSELEEIAKRFNGLLMAGRQLMTDQINAKTHEKNLELAILKSQINPHFLYNTLDAINWLAVRSNQKEIALMTRNLASFYRLSMKGKDYQSLREEILVVEAYLAIMRYRLDFEVVLETKIPDQILNTVVPTLILQPLIENAIVHGFKEQQNLHHVGRILITAYQEEAVCVCVSDNGQGMSPKLVEKVLQGLDEIYLDATAHGIMNVHKRLNLQFGLEYGIDSISSEQTGTTICLKLPVIHREES